MSESKFKVSQLIAFVKKMVGQPYWYGCCGYMCTESRLQSKANQYPEHYKSDRMSRYRDDISKKKVCADCIGLIKAFFWTDGGNDIIRYLNGEVPEFSNKYASNGMPDKSANGMFSWCKSKGCKNGKIATMPDVPGLLVFMDGHVGVYIGNGKVVEERGFNYGCVETVLKNRKWVNWSYMPDDLIEYDMGADMDIKPDAVPAEPEKKPEPVRALGSRNLKEGHKGNDVAKMQDLLNSIGFNCGEVDGDFGNNTEKGLKEFQKAHGLEVDGIYGPASHKKLLEVTSVKPFKIQVTGGTVNVRTKPDTGTGKVDYVVKAGRVLTAVGRDAATGWYKLEDGNFISHKYVKEI